MATYPTFSQLIGSNEEWMDDLKVDRAANGAPMVRSFYPSTKRRWLLKHNLNAADTATLLTFYGTYKTASNAFTWARDSVSYNVYFEAAPRVVPVDAGYNDIEIRLVQQ